MHELAVCQGLMREVERVARAAGADRVVAVTVRIGPLSGVEPQLLESAFPLASAGTVAADSRLLIERTPVRVRCQRCGGESQAASSRLVCGYCGHWRVQVLSGEELLLARVELLRECHA